MIISKHFQSFVILTFAFAFGASAVLAEVPQPKSEGKYFHGKGTKADEAYEDNAGMPLYDYDNKGLQLGPVHFRPYADYRFSWDDNVFLEEGGQEKSDYTNDFRGGVKAELPLGGGQHLLSADAGLFRQIFNRFDNQNHTDYRLGGGLKLNYVPFTLDINNVFEETESRANTEFTDRIEREENAFHSLLEVPFASFFLENEITDFNTAYALTADEGFNHNLLTVYQRVGHDLTPAMQILGEYAFINIDYNNVDDRDGVGHQYMIGLRGSWTEFLAYQAWAGVQHRIYDQDSRPDFNDFVTRGALQYEPTSLSTWILKWVRVPAESTFDGQSYYTRNRVDLTWRRQVAERVYWSSFAGVGHNEYSRITVRRTTSEEETRRDTSADAGTGLEYRMPNDIVSLLLDYRYTIRGSNLDSLDYEGNEVSVGVRAYF